jgi:hypothetical protein
MATVLLQLCLRFLALAIALAIAIAVLLLLCNPHVFCVCCRAIILEHENRPQMKNREAKARVVPKFEISIVSSSSWIMHFLFGSDCTQKSLGKFFYSDSGSISIALLNPIATTNVSLNQTMFADSRFLDRCRIDSADRKNRVHQWTPHRPDLIGITESFESEHVRR